MPHKRGDSKYWQISVNGVRESSGTTDYHRAKTLEHKLNHEAWDAQKLGIRFSRWEHACVDWLKKKQGMKSLPVYQQYGRFWHPHLAGKQLKSITGEMVREILMREGRPNSDLAVPANTTANLKLSFVRKIMRHAKMPFECESFSAPKGREDWLSVEQWQSLEMHDEMRQLATFSLSTGLREANVTGLQWDWIKGDSLVIPSEFAKTARPYGLPLNRTASSVLQERRRSPVINARHVFTLKGREIYPMLLNREWKAVFADSDVPYMVYHGLRHTYASWMVQEGVPFEIVARLCQWKLPGMVHRYTHFDVESLRPWAERFDTIIARSGVKSLNQNVR
jgi:integrase